MLFSSIVSGHGLHEKRFLLMVLRSIQREGLETISAIDPQNCRIKSPSAELKVHNVRALEEVKGGRTDVGTN